MVIIIISAATYRQLHEATNSPHATAIRRSFESVSVTQSKRPRLKGCTCSFTGPCTVAASVLPSTKRTAEASMCICTVYWKPFRLPEGVCERNFRYLACEMQGLTMCQSSLACALIVCCKVLHVAVWLPGFRPMPSCRDVPLQSTPYSRQPAQLGMGLCCPRGNPK